jgi:hypothetical protein
MTSGAWSRSVRAGKATSRRILNDGSRVAVPRRGPAGSFSSYFLLDSAERLGLDPEVDLYELQDFSRRGGQGCNMCGGIVSESQVQLPSTEGINLPTTALQRGIGFLRVARG